jgi:thiosulfate/3-mercaptopyruvate sulfurtransferase
MLIDHEDLLLVDTRPFAEYSGGHIQGAVNIDLFQFHWIERHRTPKQDFVFKHGS